MLCAVTAGMQCVFHLRCAYRTCGSSFHASVPELVQGNILLSKQTIITSGLFSNPGILPAFELMGFWLYIKSWFCCCLDQWFCCLKKKIKEQNKQNHHKSQPMVLSLPMPGWCLFFKTYAVSLAPFLRLSICKTKWITPLKHNRSIMRKMTNH